MLMLVGRRKVKPMFLITSSNFEQAAPSVTMSKLPDTQGLCMQMETTAPPNSTEWIPASNRFRAVWNIILLLKVHFENVNTEV